MQSQLTFPSQNCVVVTILLAKLMEPVLERPLKELVDGLQPVWGAS